RKHKKQSDQQKQQFESSQHEWLEDMQKRISGFQKDVAPVLAMPANAKRSPVWDAVHRSELFLTENEPGLPAAHRYMLLITDGIDDVHSKPVAIQSGATVIIVNGAGEVGSLGVLQPQRFESIDAAIRFIIHTESR